MTGVLLVNEMTLNDDGAVMGLVRLNQPEQLNPLDWETVLELQRVVTRLGEDSRVRTIAITGTGRAFCAGGDMAKYIELQRDPYRYPQYNADFHQMITTICQLSKPVIALVNGVAVAGGLELVLACDFAFAGESGRIGDAHLPYGQMGGGGSLNLLPHAVGIIRARELVLSGRILGAAEAKEMGLFLKVVTDDALLQEAVDWSTTLADRSPIAVQNAKQTMNTAYWEGADLTTGLRLEREMANRYAMTYDDPHEGLLAFAEKRKPRFTGR